MRLIPGLITGGTLTVTGGTLPHIAPAEWAALAGALLGIGLFLLALIGLYAWQERHP